MKLTVFQSDKGDCLLLTGQDGKRILIDGGMRDSYQEHVAEALGRLHTQGERLDLVYVSHIDQDHISGILQMMDDLMAWRVHDFQITNGNPEHPRPKAPRPPDVGAIWHNAFHEQIGENAGSIADLLAATASILSGSPSAQLRLAAADHNNIANGEREAIRLSRRIGDRQLNIPLNPEFSGKLMFVRDNMPLIRLGGMSLRVIGPFEQDLKNLRKKWNAWLRANRQALEEIAEKARRDEDRLRAGEANRILRAALLQAEELGQRKNVTAPNLASLMLLVEEGNQFLLLTGDSHWEDILKGLRHHGKLNGGHIHVDVLKVQHHGSEHNLNAEFCRAVTADHYVFCGNGEHKNPDFRVVKTIMNSRLDGNDTRRFKLWFNSSAAITKPDNRPHMGELEQIVQQRAAQSGGRMTFRFLQRGHSFNLSL